MDQHATDEKRAQKLNEIISNEETTDDGHSERDGDVSVLNQNKGCNPFAHWIHHKDGAINPAMPPESAVDPRVSDIIVTTEQDKVKKEYPDYIDRVDIYNNYILEHNLCAHYVGKSLEENIRAYKDLIKFLQTSEFKEFLSKKYPVVTVASPTSQQKIKRSWWKRDSQEEPQQGTIQPTVYTKLFHNINQIQVWEDERKKYQQLKDKIDEIKAEQKQIEQKIHNFKLTTHCSSVDNLIDYEQLGKFVKDGSVERTKKIREKWESRVEKDKSLSAILDDLKDVVKWELFDFYYIKWDKPFDFIKSINLKSVYQRLKSKSQPFVNTYVLPAISENLTSYCLYTDNEEWVNQIKQGNVGLNIQHSVSTTLSKHICSKICMFQFLQLTKDMTKGLVDCCDD